MKIQVEMPEVSSCSVEDCSYNRDSKCCARAITIGDAETPNCDTFFTEQRRASGSNKAGVGACKVSSCEYNEDLECQADGISVGVHEGFAYCQTYEMR